MPLRVADAFVLRTYPLKESDKIVSFFTREFGKCRGVARGARRPKSRYGSALEPLSQVRVQYFEREGKELCQLDHCELISSMVEASGAGLLESVAVAVMAEVADRLLPDHEANDAMFRLLAAVLADFRGSAEPAVWLPLTYFVYWTVRLGGYLPSFQACGLCGHNFAAQEPARFDRLHPGLLCHNCGRGGGAELSPIGRQLQAQLASCRLAEASEDLRQAAAGLPGRQLRAFMKQRMEDHLEAKLHSLPMLISLESAV